MNFITDEKRAWRHNKKFNEQTLGEYYYDRFSSATWCAWIVIGSILMCAVFVLFASVCHAEEICEEKAVHCILGEARGEGFESMKAHAEAIRNRGHLQGVYGCRADLSKEMAYLKKTGIYSLAIKAWRESRESNLVQGASFWGSLKVDGKWIRTMEKKGFKRTAVIRNTAFYREG